MGSVTATTGLFCYIIFALEHGLDSFRSGWPRRLGAFFQRRILGCFVSKGPVAWSAVRAAELVESARVARAPVVRGTHVA